MSTSSDLTVVSWSGEGDESCDGGDMVYSDDDEPVLRSSSDADFAGGRRKVRCRCCSIWKHVFSRNCEPGVYEI